ncbi:MAG: hypothetical protein JKY96_01700, partial [Phycisphaerales bacterium]|nr:hypothetical protein [Phycisphaerales bacterium]
MQFQNPENNTSSTHSAARIPGRHEQASQENSGPSARTESTRTSSIHSAPIVDRIRTRLVANLGANRVRRYLSGSVELHETAGGICVSATDTFTLDMIERRVGDDLRSALSAELGVDSASIDFTLRPADLAAAKAAATPPNRLATTIAPKAPQSKPLHYRRCPTLGEFIVGTSNRIALESIRRIIQDPT